MDVYSIPVVFEVNDVGYGRADAVRQLVRVLRRATDLLAGGTVQDWWLAEGQDKHADGNNQAAMHLVFEGPADQIVEPAEPKPGDRVRVTYEAEWVRDGSGRPSALGVVDVASSAISHGYPYTYDVPADATVEVLAPAPKPVYVNHDATEPEVGDVAIAGGEFPRLYTAPDGWLSVNCGFPTPFEAHERLTLLVHGGKPVAQ